MQMWGGCERTVLWCPDVCTCLLFGDSPMETMTGEELGKWADTSSRAPVSEYETPLRSALCTATRLAPVAARWRSAPLRLCSESSSWVHVCVRGRGRVGVGVGACALSRYSWGVRSSLDNLKLATGQIFIDDDSFPKDGVEAAIQAAIQPYEEVAKKYGTLRHTHAHACMHACVCPLKTTLDLSSLPYAAVASSRPILLWCAHTPLTFAL